MTGDDGGVIHDEMAFGRLDYVGGPDGAVGAFGGPGADGGEGGVGEEGPVYEIGRCRDGDDVGLRLGGVAVVGVVYFDDGGVGEDGGEERAGDGVGGA